MVYLDWAATAPADPLAVQDFLNAVPLRNPNSPHAEGRRSHQALEELRERAAKALGCAAGRLVFTSGGTESNAAVLSSFLFGNQGGHALVSSVEHSSLYDNAASLSRLGWNVQYLKPEASGHLDPQKACESLTDQTRLVCAMALNNETAAIADIAYLVPALRKAAKRPLHFHCDMVQAAGKMNVNPVSLDVDSASYSGHKLGSVGGSGLLYLKRPREMFNRGGGQEHGQRGGTQNLAGIASLVGALERSVAATAGHEIHAQNLLNEFCSAYRAAFTQDPQPLPIGRILPKDGRYAPSLFTLAFSPIPSEALLRALGDEGFLVGAGSACSSHRADKARVMLSLGVPEEKAHCVIRVSTGPATTVANMTDFAAALYRTVRELRASFE